MFLLSPYDQGRPAVAHHYIVNTFTLFGPGKGRLCIPLCE